MGNIKFYLSLIVVLCVFSNTAFSTTSSSDEINHVLHEVYQKYKLTKNGKNANYIPQLAKVSPNYFGIVIADVNGKISSIGDVSVPFAIESISKPFAYALALQDNDEKNVTEKVGLNATGHAFNSVIAIEERPDHLQNPFVNPGAIQITSMIKGKNTTEKWQRMLEFMQKLSIGKLYLDETVYQSETNTNLRNRAITNLLSSYNMIYSDPYDALDRYTKACSIMVTAHQLAIMGATLANHGIHPLTHQKLITPKIVQDILSQMVINGLYSDSGSWFFKVGLPAKSGVGGGIVAVVPNKMAIVVFSPPLDSTGNSVRGQLVIQYLSEKLQLHLFK